MPDLMRGRKFDMAASENGTDHVATSKPAWWAFWWSLAFGLLSLYWAAGGELGVSTLAQSIQDRTRDGDSGMRMLTAMAGLLKVAGGVVALATCQRWGHRLPRRPLLLLVGAIGVFYALYGLAGFVEKVLMATGVIDIPDAFGEGAVVWYLLLWEPCWMLGGVLFLLTAWRFRGASGGEGAAGHGAGPRTNDRRHGAR